LGARVSPTEKNQRNRLSPLTGRRRGAPLQSGSLEGIFAVQSTCEEVIGLLFLEGNRELIGKGEKRKSLSFSLRRHCTAQGKGSLQEGCSEGKKGPALL